MKCPIHNKDLEEINRFPDKYGVILVIYKCPDCSYILHKKLDK